MKQIKEYFRSWNSIRFIRVFFAIVLFAAYLSNQEPLFAFVGVMLLLQAIFNMSCPGGSCGTTSAKIDKPLIKVDEYKPQK